MSYGDHNFAHGHADTLRALLFWGTLLACMSTLAGVAYLDITASSEPAAQHTPRNLPDGNMHLLR